jgi:DNA-binding NarL/FixJ family response regulator
VNNAIGPYPWRSAAGDARRAAIRYDLTPVLEAILRAWLEGKSDDAIRRFRRLAKQTYSRHRRVILRKMSASSQGEAILLATLPYGPLVQPARNVQRAQCPETRPRTAS